ncbi:hypothetical protein BDR26DRAFT_838048 [Obelidium mucronatum]|nr:hypothetical protein BDR26DRAFT_838048 [Obelidium mucronatum]
MVAEVTALFNSTIATLDICQSPNTSTCDFYSQCLEAAHTCGPKGYSLNFGEPNCNKFITNASKFTPEGQLWLANVRSCLQKKLIPLVSREDITCDEIEDFAFDSHPSLPRKASWRRVISNICELDPLVDWVALVDTIGIKTALFKWDVLKNEEATGLSCLKQLISVARDEL